MIYYYSFLGGDSSSLPHPGVDWKLFVKKVKELNLEQPKVFCTIHNAMRPWVDIAQLNTIYGSASSSSSGCSIS
jgi:hypothetical protein